MTDRSMETTPDDHVHTTATAYESNPETYDYLGEGAMFDVFGDEFREFLSGSRVLDAGCGPGADLDALERAGVEPVGFDITESFLREARDRTDDAGTVRGDLRTLPFADESFDGVWCSASLLHVPRPDVDGALADLARVLRPGGVAFVSVKRGDETVAETDENGNDRVFTKYQPAALRERLAAANFTVERDLSVGRWVTLLATRS